MGAAVACGAAPPGLEMASEYARERSLAGADRRAPGISHPLAQAKIELELARLMTQKAAALCERRRAGR